MRAQALRDVSRDPLSRFRRVCAVFRERRVGFEEYAGHIYRDVGEAVLVLCFAGAFRLRRGFGGQVSGGERLGHKPTLPVESAEGRFRPCCHGSRRGVFRAERSPAVYRAPYLPPTNPDKCHDGETGGEGHTRKTPDVPGFVAHARKYTRQLGISRGQEVDSQSLEASLREGKHASGFIRRERNTVCGKERRERDIVLRIGLDDRVVREHGADAFIVRLRFRHLRQEGPHFFVAFGDGRVRGTYGHRYIVDRLERAPEVGERVTQIFNRRSLSRIPRILELVLERLRHIRVATLERLDLRAGEIAVIVDILLYRRAFLFRRRSAYHAARDERVRVQGCIGARLIPAGDGSASRG